MDKATFIERAHLYYAIAIAAYFLESHDEVATQGTIEGHYTFQDFDDPQAETSYLINETLFDRAVLFLAENGLIEIVTADFGPPIYVPAVDFDDKWITLSSSNSLPFAIHKQLGKSAKNWLFSALRDVDAKYRELEITQADFERPDAEWEPIALEREDRKLVAVQNALSSTIDELRGDNGYNVSFPEEKAFVTDSLQSGLQRLQNSASISVGYLKRKVLSPLGTLIKRFGKASLGIAAEAAKQTIIEWLKSKGIFFMDNL